MRQSQMLCLETFSTRRIALRKPPAAEASAGGRRSSVFANRRPGLLQGAGRHLLLRIDERDGRGGADERTVLRFAVQLVALFGEVARNLDVPDVLLEPGRPD